MSDQLIGTLQEFYVARKKEALKDGRDKLIKIIFHRGDRHMEQNHVWRVFKRILSKAGLRGIRRHDIRHSFASLLLTDRASPVNVKKQLGHSSSNRDIVNRLDDPQQSAP